jgi:hypothetical protein
MIDGVTFKLIGKKYGVPYFDDASRTKEISMILSVLI